MDEEVQAVRDAVRAFAQISDPYVRARKLAALLSEWPDIHAEVRRLRQDTFVEMHANGATYQQIGHQLGMTKERAWQIAKGRTTGPVRDDED